ncbi:NAD(P)H-binding protein [Paraglaciecola sp.]|uniref:NAD(P)H-binding protein n=1 Tax=Paraglaciecola sp. TaxID=1920173 RepID=UPI0030F3A355
MSHSNKIIMLGATGAVGNNVALTLSKMQSVQQLTLLGRRPAENVAGQSIFQHEIDIFSPKSYEHFLKGHDCAICALGVGQPSKMSKEEFIKIDKNAVLDFATACKKAGVTHFELLSSVGVSSTSSSFYLRTKGELEEGLKALGFERLSLFHPSMIMTPTNRYGLSQAITLAVMPFLDPLFIGSFNKLRSISAARLGAAMAMNLFKNNSTNRVDILNWRDFIELSK